MTDPDFIVALGAITLLAAIGLGGVALTNAQCQSKARALGIPATWGPLQGCIVTYKGEKIPIEGIGVRTIEGSP